ncbi:MAG TPA: hypothetical protein VFV87_00390, partial [Pirellulaceae bacterium]|nr:hypothetical protein [Pirellulaceae bacterium]
MPQLRDRRTDGPAYRRVWWAFRLALFAAGVAALAHAGSPYHWEDWFASGGPWSSARAQEKADGDAADQPAPATPAEAFRFDVPLPITGLVDQQVTSSVERALRKLPQGGPRPVFIFEFRPKANSTGEGSDFGRALTLARYLAGDRLSGVRTVAWLPNSVKGHAVLPVLACEQIVMHKEAELGAAGIDEKTIDPALRSGYTEIAERRRTVPTAIALGMLDKSLAVYKVTTPDGVRYETEEELKKLRDGGLVTKEDNLFQPGDEHVLTGQEMRFELGFASHLAEDRRSLAAALQLPLRALSQNLAPEEGW